MRLDQSPFVVIAVLGQELLSAGCFSAAVVVLESALRIGTCSLKLRGSVFSALSSAHWGLHNTDKAIACMLQDLAIAKSLGESGDYIDGLVQERCNPSALAMELRLCCINPSISSIWIVICFYVGDLVQECGNSSALAVDCGPQFCVKISIYVHVVINMNWHELQILLNFVKFILSWGQFH